MITIIKRESVISKVHRYRLDSLKNDIISDNTGSVAELVFNTLVDDKQLDTFFDLVENGSLDINYSDNKGRNIMFYSIRDNDIESLKKFIDMGGNVHPNLDETGRSPIDYLPISSIFMDDLEVDSFIVELKKVGVINDDIFNNEDNFFKACERVGVVDRFLDAKDRLNEKSINIVVKNKGDLYEFENT